MWKKIKRVTDATREWIFRARCPADPLMSLRGSDRPRTQTKVAELKSSLSLRVPQASPLQHLTVEGARVGSGER